MTHPQKLITRLFSNLRDEDPFRDTELRLVAYVREGAKEGGADYQGNNQPGATADWRQGVSVAPIAFNNDIDLKIQQAICKLARAVPEKENLDHVEWGVSMDMGDRLMLAADLETGISAADAHRTGAEMGRLFRSLSDGGAGDVLRFRTGHGYHVYLDVTLPIAHKAAWFEGLQQINGVDLKWASFAMRQGNVADQGVLRWSAGQDGRVVPEILGEDADLL